MILVLAAMFAAVDADADGWISTVDCDDTDPTVHPDAWDVPNDGIDQDCDGADATEDEAGDTGGTDGPGDTAEAGDSGDSGDSGVSGDSGRDTATSAVDTASIGDLGACCEPNLCIDLPEATCTAEGGLWTAGESCDDAAFTCCAPTVGACCLDDACHELNQHDCATLGGAFAGVGVDCAETDATCTPPKTGGCATVGGGGRAGLGLALIGALLRRRRAQSKT